MAHFIRVCYSQDFNSHYASLASFSRKTAEKIAKGHEVDMKTRKIVEIFGLKNIITYHTIYNNYGGTFDENQIVKNNSLKRYNNYSKC